jgi:hypothetical protein
MPAGSGLRYALPLGRVLMKQIFKLEYHPVGTNPRRIRFLLQPEAENIRQVTEERVDGTWTEVRVEIVEYFEYSDD